MTLPAEETFSFQAEAAQILDLMANSLYSDKEIFLRELISNSSDAIDRFRIERFTAPESTGEEADDEPRIRVGFDRDARTITIADNGVGMTRDAGRSGLGLESISQRMAAIRGKCLMQPPGNEGLEISLEAPLS